MPKESKVTYQIVKAASDKMYEEGTRPTNDRIRLVTGGAADIVARHLRRWWDEHSRIKLLKGTTLDECIKVAIYDEINRHVSVHAESLDDLLNHERESNLALDRQIAELHDEVEDLKGSSKQTAAEHQKEVITLEKKNTASETKLKDLKSHYDVTKEQLREVNQKVSELEKNNGKQEEQIKLLHDQINESNKALTENRDKLHESEKALAVAQTRLEPFDKSKSTKK